MQWIQYVRGLGWTSEQLVVLAAAFGAACLGVFILGALRRLFGFDGVSALRAELKELRQRVDDVDEVHDAAQRCLDALRDEWPDGASRMAEAAVSSLLEEVAKKPEQYGQAWRALHGRIDTLVADQVDALQEDDEVIMAIQRSARRAAFEQALSLSADSQVVRDVAERLFRAVVFKVEAALSADPPEELMKCIELALRGIMQEWIDDSDGEFNF